MVNIARNTSKREIQKTAEATGDFIGNKITNSMKLQNNNYKIIELPIQMLQKIHHKIIQKQLQMSTMKKYLKKCINLQKKKQEIIDKLRLKNV